MIFIGLGSSLGNAEAIFASTENFLIRHQLYILHQSNVFKNPPLGGIAQNEFSNAVWELNWTPEAHNQTPQHLLQILQECEAEHGRIRKKKWEDRTLDLDILMYGDIIMQSKSLTLPHSEIPKRNFVLLPWQEIVDPNFRIPKYGKITTLLQKLK